MSKPIPIDVLAAARNCILQAMKADAGGTALPEVPPAVLNQAIESMRTNNPPPAGGISLVDKTATLLKTIIKELYDPFRAALATGRIERPFVEGGGLRLKTAAALPLATETPAVFLIEEYRLTSFLGRYGLGRTLTAMSLFPGEETTIRLKSWRNSSTTRTDTSSVIDSEEKEISNRFSEKVSQESSNTTTVQEKSSWEVAGSASADWGVAKASVSGGASAETQTGREHFARIATEQVGENAREARSHRKTEVGASTTTSVAEGEEESIERVIRNINLRRTLNFIFRELNQEYVTRLHMTGIRFAYAIPGKAGTWTEYTLDEFPTLLDIAIVQPRRKQVAADILATVATVHDLALKPVYPLQLIKVAPNGSLTVSELKPIANTANGLNPDDMPVKGSRRSLRWKPGPLSPANADPSTDPQTEADPHAVDGVLSSQQFNVMPTGAIVVDAALGKQDALDYYAIQSQNEQLAEIKAANRRETLLNEALALLEPEQRVRAYAEATFGPPSQKASQFTTSEPVRDGAAPRGDGEVVPRTEGGEVAGSDR
jgi:hypothetical protein